MMHTLSPTATPLPAGALVMSTTICEPSVGMLARRYFLPLMNTKESGWYPAAFAGFSGMKAATSVHQEGAGYLQ